MKPEQVAGQTEIRTGSGRGVVTHYFSNRQLFIKLGYVYSLAKFTASDSRVLSFHGAGKAANLLTVLE